MNKLENHQLKLKKIFESITHLIEEYYPDEVAVEAPFFGKNVQSMLKLGRAQGVAMAATLVKGLPIEEYSPRKIKQSMANAVIISAQKHLMISELKKKIVEKMESNFQTVEFQIPYKNGKGIANAQKGVQVLERNFEDTVLRLKVRGAKPRIKQIVNSMS